MDDVKDQISESAPQEAAVETETTEQDSQPAEQTTEADVEEIQERTVPISVVQKERKQRQEAQRRLAELERQSQLGQYDPSDLEGVLSHPVVQELMLKQAKQELTDFAREVTEQYPNMHPQVKKAILSNARGFVNESTTDIEQAKIDLVDYIESIVEEAADTQTTPDRKTIQVAKTNVSTVAPSATPAEVLRILNKPVDEWTEKESDQIDAYKAANPKK